MSASIISGNLKDIYASFNSESKKNDYLELLNHEIIKELIKSGYETNDDLSEWCWYSDPKILTKVADLFKSHIEEKCDDIDIIASCGASGCPLASYLSLNLGKEFIFINDRWGITKKFQPIKPQKCSANKEVDNLRGKTVLLVDSVLKTGYTLYNAIRLLEEENVGEIIIVMISLLPTWKDDGIFKSIDKYDVYFLFKWDLDICKEAKNKQILVEEA